MSILHGLFTIGFNSENSGGPIILLPTVNASPLCKKIIGLSSTLNGLKPAHGLMDEMSLSLLHYRKCSIERKQTKK